MESLLPGQGAIALGAIHYRRFKVLERLEISPMRGNTYQKLLTTNKT